MNCRYIVGATFFLFFASVVLAPPAHAYIDPGTGSYILQLFLAGLFGALYTIRLYWVRIKHFLSNLFDKKVDDE
ncbi:hypothetical protein MNBD_NITROSPINAE02-305 [hydrothermal vent metagenome]|uniref:Uncharacterized protein n=1 Tax=hydrothermal vent metagenome TaxID=652676 RepID=A0A3B1BDL3_9ZZZZ